MRSSWNYLLLVYIFASHANDGFCCCWSTRLTEPQLVAFQMVKSCLSNSFLSTPLLKTLFQTAPGVVESRSQALAGQRLLTDNGFPLWVSCGQGNKSSEDLDWTNYGSVLRWQSDNKIEGGRQDRAKAEIKKCNVSTLKTSHTLTHPPPHTYNCVNVAYFIRFKNVKNCCSSPWNKWAKVAQKLGFN